MKRIRNLLIIFLTMVLFSCLDENPNDMPLEVEINDFIISGYQDEEQVMKTEGYFTQTIFTTQAADAEGSNINLVLSRIGNKNDHITIQIIVNGDNDGVNPDAYELGEIDVIRDLNEGFAIVTLVIDNELYGNLSGRVILESVSDQLIKGRVDVELININNEKVQIEGEFEATGVTVII